MRILFLCQQWHATRTPCRTVGAHPDLQAGGHHWFRAVGALEGAPSDICFDVRSDTLCDIAGRVPGGYPDVAVVWEPGYQTLPAGMEDAPFPVVACYSDWNLVMPAQVGMLDLYDYLFTDRRGVRILGQMGYGNAEFWPMWGHDPEFSRVLPDVEQVWDVGMIGNLNPDVQRERAPWLARVARLADRYQVRIAGGVFGAEYTRMMNATKITFNRSIRGEMNMRCYEAAACGSLLFYEEENEEIREFFEDRVHCVLYNEQNLEALLAYYLTVDDERQRIVDAARERVSEFSFPRSLNRLACRLESLGLEARRGRTFASTFSLPERLKRQARQGLGSPTTYSTSATVTRLTQAVAAAPGDAAAHNDLAVANVSLMAKSLELRQRVALTRTSLEHMEQAVKLQPGSAFYALNLAHMYADAQRPEAALDRAQQALGLIDAGVEDPADPLCLAFPFAWNEQRVQFSTVYNLTRTLPEGFAALQRCLMLYRGGLLLGRLAEQQEVGALALLGYRVAVAARPDLGTGRIELARALAAAGEEEEALRHAQMGVESDPFLTRGWLLQVELLVRLGREAEARRFVREHLTILDAVAPRQGVQGLSRALGEWDEVRQALQDVRFEDAVAA